MPKLYRLMGDGLVQVQVNRQVLAKVTEQTRQISLKRERDLVAHVVNLDELGAGYRFRERATMLQAKHLIFGAVHDQRAGLN